MERYLHLLNAWTSGVNVTGGTNVVFGAARMPAKVKVLVYKTARSATAALARGSRLVAAGQFPPSTQPAMVRQVRNVVIEMEASVYARNARSLERALSNLDLAATSG
jgi:hypothetical protein